MCSCSSLRSRGARCTVGDSSIGEGWKVIAGCCINRVTYISATIQARTITLWYLVHESDVYIRGGPTSVQEYNNNRARDQFGGEIT